jgi:hypothetical protein
MIEIGDIVFRKGHTGIVNFSKIGLVLEESNRPSFRRQFKVHFNNESKPYWLEENYLYKIEEENDS